MRETLHLLEETDFPTITRDRVKTLQVNLGYKCNQTCTHCHVNAGPNRKEMMTADNISVVYDYLRYQNIQTLDLTGGAPELHSMFREVVETARSLDCHVMDRCNLTVLEEAGQENTAEFLAQHQVEIVASLPCYLEENVDKQRGKGVFEKSIRGLQTLNALGYGKEDENLKLTLVYNPQGPQLPPSQESLKQDYSKFLAEQFGISFNELFTITNMPIQRFGSMLVSKGLFDEYMQLLRGAYSADNLQSVMCRSMVSVDWQGYVYDCDFNQMLGMGLPYNEQIRTHLSELINSDLRNNKIAIANHCYGCTAGQGSSCGGALN